MEPGKRGNDKFVQNVNQRWNMEPPVLKSPRFPDKKEKTEIIPTCKGEKI